MDNQIEEIKSKLNILDVVGNYVKLTKTGINYRGICPFHPEKTPSFFVSPTRQMWHCFGCGAGFSAFDFVMKIEGVEFGDALRILANKAGVELKRENIKLRTERQRLYEICELACLFFEKQLENSAVGKEAEGYLLKRGIKKESVKKWKLGYSPDTWNSLTDFLISKGYDREEIVKAGLAIKKEGSEGDSYDRFRGRIIFPVFDLNSQVVGFGGRVFSARGGSSPETNAPREHASGGKQFNDEIAKYINTPQTMIYDKSALLYGLNSAKLAVRRQNQCVVTEGYTDVIMCHQAGFENVVASSGTALTSRHLSILKRYSENLVLAFDMDVAGDSATKKGINSAQEQGFNIKIVEAYLKDSDPADIILKDAKLWEDAVNKARSIMDYYFDSAFSSFDKNTAEGKKEIGKIILPAVKRLQNKIEQSYWVQKLSEMLGVKEEAVIEELIRTTMAARHDLTVERAEVSNDFQDKDLSSGGRKKLIEERIISLILKNPDYVKFIDESQYNLFPEKIINFFKKIKEITDLPPESSQQKKENKDLKVIFDNIISESGESDYEFKNFLAALALKGDLDHQEEDSQKEIQLCLLQLKNIELKNKLNKISEDIKKAESEKDFPKVKNLIEEFNKLTKEL